MNLHAKPGSVVWLLKWDLIQLWNWLGTTSERRIGKRYAWLSRLLLLVLLHMPALLILLLPAPERRWQARRCRKAAPRISARMLSFPNSPQLSDYSRIA